MDFKNIINEGRAKDPRGMLLARKKTEKFIDGIWDEEEFQQIMNDVAGAMSGEDRSGDKFDKAYDDFFSAMMGEVERAVQKVFKKFK